MSDRRWCGEKRTHRQRTFFSYEIELYPLGFHEIITSRADITSRKSKELTLSHAYIIKHSFRRKYCRLKKTKKIWSKFSCSIVHKILTQTWWVKWTPLLPLHD